MSLFSIFFRICQPEKVMSSEADRDQQKYSEKSETIIGLDPYILNSFSYLDPI